MPADVPFVSPLGLGVFTSDPSSPAKGDVFMPSAAPALRYFDGSSWDSVRQLVLDPRDFGAKIDGSTNDSAAWVSTIAAIPSSGATVLAPAGTSIVDFGEIV